MLIRIMLEHSIMLHWIIERGDMPIPLGHDLQL